jgi:hypothetical protein
MSGFLLGSWASMWRVPRTFLGVAFASFGFAWLRPSHVGADVDRLACFLHRPTVYGWQAWVQCFLTSNALYHHVVVGDGAFPGGVKLPGLDIYYGVDYWGLAP